MLFTNLASGTYQVGAIAKGGQSVALGTVCAYPLQVEGEGSEGESAIGQWLFHLSAPGSLPPKSRQRLSQLLEGVTARLGLLPVRLSPSFRQALLSSAPLCLVADTSSLYHGTLEQALKLRRGKPTHVAIPDQVFMELQRQRERSASYRGVEIETPAEKSVEDPLINWIDEVFAQRRYVIGIRVLRRLALYGAIVHFVRPPEAMVRYFGAERGSSTSEDAGAAMDSDTDDVGPDYYRDRLILEAARQQQLQLPSVPVWLVTADAKLAVQAQVEGFHSGFGQRATAPDPFIITSPYMGVHDLKIYHVSAWEFFEELVWSWRSLTLQSKNSAERLEWRLPEQKLFEAALLELREGSVGFLFKKAVSGIRWLPGDGALHIQVKGASIEGMDKFGQPPTMVPASKSAPEAAKLINALLYLVQNGHISSFAYNSYGESVVAYLKALGWADELEDKVRPTPRAESLARAWNSLRPSDVRAWAAWLTDAAVDLSRLQPIAALLAALPTAPGEKIFRASLEEQLGCPTSSLKKQAALSNAFGLLVRLSGTIWACRPFNVEDAARLIVAEIGSGIRLDRLFTSLLKKNPISIPLFRGALMLLWADGRIRPDGALPDAGGGEGSTPVRVGVTVPIVPEGKEVSEAQAQSIEYNLGNGDFLPVGQSCQAIFPRE